MAVDWQMPSKHRGEIAGELNRHSMTNLPSPRQLLKGQSGAVVVGLSQLTRIDSAGVAWLLELKQQASHQGIALTFEGHTESLSKLLGLYSLQEIV